MIRKPNRLLKKFPSDDRLPSSRARGKPLEIGFQDEARIGQQGTLTRIWAKQGSRPRAPRDLCHEWAEIFGAVCPARRATAALVLPYANTEAFSLHLAESSQIWLSRAKEVASGAQAVRILDGAGYPAATDLKTPDTITLLPLPSSSPELNPMDNLWESLRKNKLAITVVTDDGDIVAKSCEAWNVFADDKPALASITSRDWAQVNL